MRFVCRRNRNHNRGIYFQAASGTPRTLWQKSGAGHTERVRSSYSQGTRDPDGHNALVNTQLRDGKRAAVNNGTVEPGGFRKGAAPEWYGKGNSNNTGQSVNQLFATPDQSLPGLVFFLPPSVNNNTEHATFSSVSLPAGSSPGGAVRYRGLENQMCKWLPDLPQRDLSHRASCI